MIKLFEHGGATQLPAQVLCVSVCVCARASAQVRESDLRRFEVRARNVSPYVSLYTHARERALSL